MTPLTITKDGYWNIVKDAKGKTRYRSKDASEAIQWAMDHSSKVKIKEANNGKHLTPIQLRKMTRDNTTIDFGSPYTVLLGKNCDYGVLVKASRISLKGLHFINLTAKDFDALLEKAIAMSRATHSYAQFGPQLGKKRFVIKKGRAALTLLDPKTKRDDSKKGDDEP